MPMHGNHASCAVTALGHNRNFKLLFFAQFISLAGRGVTTVGLALFADQLLGSDSAAVT